MPFSSIHKFTEFNEFHHAANGLVRSAHSEIHIFRFEDIGKQVIKNMPLFRTSFYQIGLMRNAKFSMSIYDTVHQLDEQCALVFFKPGQLIQFESDPNWQGYVLMFKESFLSIKQDNPNAKKEFTLLDPTTESFTLITKDIYDELSGIYEKILHEYTNDFPQSLPVIELYIHILFYKIERLCKISKEIDEKLFSSRKAEITYQFKKLIQNNLRTSKSVTDYADMLHISPKYLIEVVSDVTNQSPKELINEQIILEVKTLLKHTDYPISDIATAYHFTDQSHFANFFKKATSLSPLEYRNLHRSDFKK
ncbi:helix-turn-helix domain-containing protein [Thermoflexibacter ruber]|uniref:AraC-type DNA-binding protein n=1 Tax=Thermoflexibacter ruber TaxID=1003 RepID=A0A1I2CUM2_9BACT|nr:AraC family transcriptional regulator [Thermoflexibacter ruber]SFE72026.1 AraC-type DNA-binding protein [Thermoflexibacter ruber]